MNDELEFLTVETAHALAGLAEQIANGGDTAGWDSTLDRWWSNWEAASADWARWRA